MRNIQGNISGQEKDFVSAMEELQEVASDAGKPYLLWEVFEELMLIAGRIKYTEMEKKAERKKKWKIVSGGKNSR